MHCVENKNLTGRLAYEEEGKKEQQDSGSHGSALNPSLNNGTKMDNVIKYGVRLTGHRSASAWFHSGVRWHRISETETRTTESGNDNFGVRPWSLLLCNIE